MSGKQKSGEVTVGVAEDRGVEESRGEQRVEGRIVVQRIAERSIGCQRREEWRAIYSPK